jgi:hypothetical protein
LVNKIDLNGQVKSFLEVFKVIQRFCGFDMEKLFLELLKLPTGTKLFMEILELFF